MIALEDIDTDEDGALTASAELPGGRRITVQYDFDDDFDLEEGEDEASDDDDAEDDDFDPETLPDIDEMQRTSERALARLSADVLDTREREVAQELAEAVVEDDSEDVDALAAEILADLTLDGVVVFGDGGMTLLYVAPEQFPETTLFCLLDDDLEIDDLLVE